MELTETSCDICNSDDRTGLFVKEGFVHVRCNRCGLVYVSPRLKDHLAGQVFSGTAEMGDESLSGSQVKRILSEVKRLEKYRTTNQILEIGAGKGWFLEQAKNMGWETWAVEVNAKAIDRLEDIGLKHVLNQSAELFEAPDGHFDVVRMWDVIEHLQSPRKALERACRALRPGGLIRLSTTNFASLSRIINGPEWVYLNGADHIILFEPDTIDRILRHSGFSNIRIKTRSFNLRRKLYHPEKDLTKVPLFVKPLRKFIDEMIRFSRFGHQMIVEASKY
jgi:2-polyprenyl-3-methyl-5-hydroxy-6-metoxy-1,4-benzoquinol methylase